jgi:glyoxylase-like metal-dependent hydrolase (beta-lactamase superfamily II)
MQIKLFISNPFQENTYLLLNEHNEGVLIDPGFLGNEEENRFTQYIDANEISLKRVLNTHLHLDHVFGNRFIFEKYGISPEASKDDEFQLQNFGKRAELFGIGNIEETIPLGKYLQEGDKIELGNIKLEVLQVPGHSPGSLVFYAPESHCLFAGDVLFQGSIGRTDLPGGDYNELISAIRSKLFTLPDETIVFSGHGSKTSIGEEKKYNPFLK